MEKTKRDRQPANFHVVKAPTIQHAHSFPAALNATLNWSTISCGMLAAKIVQFPWVAVKRLKRFFHSHPGGPEDFDFGNCGTKY